ncbi:DNA topoisomerase IV subunit A [Sideroxydans lithotrophicus]|uniref:DNA topoisomerase 4 subunit A n=1 Tax=Sideroxydans lithotrophicus (strain ES-1) TaxID=580332 RepID=D5CPL2_SIDLE|nr:DNA topoisomerase IV subunit A [Sideroxydans lithotrophicus]ADE13007.1 DNA topoisomerase IV, A subunit [Sideroxydans lithotrophicus ES-1]
MTTNEIDPQDNQQPEAAAPAPVEPTPGKREFAPLAPLPDADEVKIAEYAERAYLEYAVSVVKGRALPEVCDGQKPVQRRILYAMRQMGLTHGNKHVKSARVVGDVLGKYHPHGDSSAYEAMVRLAQDFAMRYPLVDGQGNFGSRDGDNAAAMRYTEARLTPIADLLLSELDMGTVDFIPNYDGAFQEPAMLPARLPMVLLNGASGIAVGMATEIPSHNLKEVAKAAVALAKNPNVKDDKLLSYISGPDFPGGGQIISSAADIRDAYASGRGSLKMRARWSIEQLARGQWQVVVSEFPHGVSAQKVLEEIDELTNPKVKANKKSLTPEQTQNKQLILSVLDAVADESDKSQKTRLVFQPKSSKQSPDDMMAVLLTHTSLQNSVSVNLTMIGLDGRPQQKALTQVLREWVEFRLRTVTRRCDYRLGQVNDRLHILAGRMIVYLNIDEVIKVIRNSDAPKEDLMKKFDLSERQAEDILEIRLRQLARLEGIKIEREIKELKAEAKELKRVLGSEEALRELVVGEIEADAKQYGDERRTLIEEAQITKVTAQVSDEPVTVFISQRFWVRTRLGHGIDASAIAFKDGDSIAATYECRTTDQCIVICSNGRVCSIPVSALPTGRGDGAPLATFIELAPGAKIAHAFCGKTETPVLISTSAGYGFPCFIGDMVGRNKAGKQFISVKEETILPPVLLAPTQHSLVAALSKNARLLVFVLSELKLLQGGGKGMMLIDLKEGDELTACTVINTPELTLGGTVGSKVQQLKIGGKELQTYFGARAKAGKVVETKQKALRFE